MEELAARWLTVRGARILERQYRTREGEVDLIYEDGTELVFGEVKYRGSCRYGSPAEAVDFRKQRRIIRAAMVYAARYGRGEDPIRFDVIEMTEQAGTVYIRQLKAAFVPE